ncbi:hypothetical protein QFZ35_001917 [Arthrobacter ulcerisalmonis]|uniref:hypothetical protein n=1 Tax=Arthrobacter sp. B1I2 TaxID=3042263 RepID=UPI002783D0BB|nr:MULTISPECIES: hypothetical protein [Arthrobacter]MDQ0663419.1 hypothetical protein [Arthrobacter ulcerisalmonis]MDQ0731309.1 hypothetical protein [Arthrobacter sp. B1I2]
MAMESKTTGKVRSDRTYFFAQDADRQIFAYTEAEWGVGGAQPFGNYTARSIASMSLLVAFLTIPALLAPVLLIMGVVGMHLGAILFSLIFTVLCTGGWLLTMRSLRGELRARRLRRERGLPPPSVVVTDDQARAWYTAHPGSIPVTRDNFPESTHPFPGEAP